MQQNLYHYHHHHHHHHHRHHHHHQTKRICFSCSTVEICNRLTRKTIASEADRGVFFFHFSPFLFLGEGGMLVCLRRIATGILPFWVKTVQIANYWP